MKYLLTFILTTLLLFNLGCGQIKPKQAVSSFITPANWISNFTDDSSFFPLFERKQIARWTFTNKSDSTLKVTFYVFNYTSSDSTFFNDKGLEYAALSSCLLISSERPDENFTSFQRENYFFLIKMCPCNTKDNQECKQLAKQLFEWIKRR